VVELVIFDCDGVLVDSDRISLRIQAEWISALGLETTYEDCVRDFLGLGMPATLRILTERLGRPLPSGWEEDLDAAVCEGFRRELRAVPDVVEALGEIDLPTCVASSGSQKMRFTLGLTGLWDRFAGYAASCMATPPERCIVVEDSPFGVAGAKAAGMAALGYAPEGAGEVLEREGATVFESMVELPTLLELGGPLRR
jgi:HAD superfamily hydrolase (TIGR01509 family)